jgi:predicted CopG family antitoxin
MSEEVRERLESLREKTDADSLSEVIRRALAVYDFLWSEREKGARLVARGADNKERDLVLL